MNNLQELAEFEANRFQPQNPTQLLEEEEELSGGYESEPEEGVYEYERKRALQPSQKQPYIYQEPADEDFEQDFGKNKRVKEEWAELSDIDEPDLDTYFDELLVPNARRIAICRAYASYLASLKKKDKK